MKYLLDTNVLICMFKNQHGIRERILSEGLEECAVSEITLAELYYGAAKGGSEKHIREVGYVQQMFTILPSRPAYQLYGELKADLEKKQQRLDDFDLLIGSTALHNGLTIVTHNRKHYDRIVGLKVEDWENE